jgi:hypothetical protein
MSSVNIIPLGVLGVLARAEKMLLRKTVRTSAATTIDFP